MTLDAPVIAVAAGLGSIWALDSGSTLYRLDSGRARVTRGSGSVRTRRTTSGSAAGSVWVADDQGATRAAGLPGEQPRRRPHRGRDGPADMVFAGTRAWLLTHRDNTLYRIDTTSNEATLLSTLGGDDAAAERLALLGGRLWVTGRGVPLLEVDPETGATGGRSTSAARGSTSSRRPASLWIPTRTAEVDRTGFPTMAALRRVTPAGAVSTAATAQGRVDVHGLAAGKGSIWLADNTQGLLYRVPT